ncbi:hypothetical protein [Lentzea sp. NPDC004782]|uniref:hypothetical protein n=1 Tax=Lentzea sp. NPDC004782 TaxID=3154458 RepID=UPI0033A8F734
MTDERAGEPTFLPSNANRDRRTISDFLMTTMGTPQIELPGGRVQSILTFHDVQMLTHLRQTKISNQLLGDNNGERMSQAAVFTPDVVLGAYAPEVEEHRRECKRINRRLNRLQQNLGAIKGFPSERKHLTEQQLLTEQLACEQAIREATRAVGAATARLAPEEATDLALAEAVDRAKATLQATKEEEAALRAELSRLNSAVSTRQKSLKRMRKLGPAPWHCSH